MSGTKIALAASLTVALATTAIAQETHKLKFSSVFPAAHWTWELGGSVFTKKVSQLTNGQVTFDLFPAGQLGKEGTNILSSRLAETAFLVPSYEPAKLPMSSVAELPGFYNTSCEGTAKFWHSLKEGDALYEAEYKRQGLVPLYVNVLPAFHLVTAKKQVKSLEDVAGLKLRANGTALTKTATALSAVPVTVTTTEFYDSLTRGTVDGGFYYMGSVKQTGLDSAIRYSLSGAQIGGGATIYAISQRAWNALDRSTQQALRKAGEETQQELCAALDNREKQLIDELVAEGKLTVTTVEGQERERWVSTLQPVAKEWAAQLDATKRPGTPVVDAFRAAQPQF